MNDRLSNTPSLFKTTGRWTYRLRHMLMASALWLVSTQANALCLLCSCTVSSQPVTFGVYNPLSGNSASGTGNVHLSCSGLSLATVGISVALSPGLYGVSAAARQMAKGTSRLDYTLYGPSGGNPCGAIWGDGSGGTGVLSGSLLLNLLGLASLDQQVCGSIPANQTTVSVGTYTDSVAVVVTYN